MLLGWTLAVVAIALERGKRRQRKKKEQAVDENQECRIEPDKRGISAV
jgi:hypothetical protein